MIEFEAKLARNEQKRTPTMTTSVPESGSVTVGTQSLAERFRAVYGQNPHGIFRAPGRVNLIGEHTDYNDGFAMPAAIDFSCYSAVEGRLDNTLPIYSEFQEAIEFDLVKLAEPPTKHCSDYIRGVAATLREEGYPLKGAPICLSMENTSSSIRDPNEKRPRPLNCDSGDSSMLRNCSPS